MSSGAVLAGIGATEFSTDSGRSELQLAAEAILAAVADAGMPVTDVDGMVIIEGDTNDPLLVAGCLGIPEVRYFSSVPYGGGGVAATIMHAGQAIAAGAADTVVVYRALNERSGRRFGQPVLARRSADPPYALYGLGTIGQIFSLHLARYMHEYGVSNADLAPFSVAMRAWAATNPAARFFGRPITLEDHQASRWIAEPVLRLFDCCLESDGAVAVVLTRDDRLPDLPHPAVRLVGAAQGLAGSAWPRNYYGSDLTVLPESGVLGRGLWQNAGVRPEDISVAIVYDHFAPMAVLQLEALGFCGPGDGAALIAAGNIGPKGNLPVNPHGGQIGEAYIHGMNGVAEAVRQLRGTAVNQVDDVELVAIASGSGVPTSAVVLGREID